MHKKWHYWHQSKKYIINVHGFPASRDNNLSLFTKFCRSCLIVVWFCGTGSSLVCLCGFLWNVDRNEQKVTMEMSQISVNDINTTCCFFLYAVKHFVVCLALKSAFYMNLVSTGEEGTSNLHFCNYTKKLGRGFAQHPRYPLNCQIKQER